MKYTLKPLTPVEDQIAAYRLQFELHAKLVSWLETHPPSVDLPEYLRKQVLTPERIAANWYAIRARSYNNWAEQYSEQLRQATESGWTGLFWNWDESWDGLLVARVASLDREGFGVQSFMRKMKVSFRIPEGCIDKNSAANTRFNTVSTLILAVGGEWAGINFKGKHTQSGSVWWQGGQPWRSYRP